MFFKIKKTTPLEKLMNTFCERQGKPHKYYRFIFDGERISETSTPLGLELEENDIIQAALEQNGGF